MATHNSSSSNSGSSEIDWRIVLFFVMIVIWGLSNAGTSKKAAQPVAGYRNSYPVPYSGSGYTPMENFQHAMDISASTLHTDLNAHSGYVDSYYDHKILDRQQEEEVKAK